MAKRISLAALVVALFVCFSLVATAQEKKKDAKKGMTELKSVSCDPTCGFKVQSHDEQELTDIVIAHAKKAHNMDITAKDVKAKMKTVTMKAEKKEKS